MTSGRIFATMTEGTIAAFDTVVAFVIPFE
jgi:hypothetical protein